MEKYRSRSHMLLLYPDDATHMKALETIEKSYDYVGIIHNKDVWTQEDEKKNPEHVAGELKKEHYHIILRFKQAVWSTALSKELGIEEYYIQNIKRFENALQYLIHYNDNDKTQYSVDDVFGPLKSRLVESIVKVEMSEGEKVSFLIEYINEYDGVLSVTDFAYYCAKNGFWAEFRRSGAIFCKIIEEHNEKYKSRA